jgi:hypothetical protein
MSQALLCSPPTPRHQHTATEAGSLRAETEATLRDLAFVLRMTQRVKASIVGEVAERTACTAA